MNFVHFTYAIILPICFLSGFPGHVIALATYIKQRKEEKAFSYQMLVEAGRIYGAIGARGSLHTVGGW